MRGLLAEMRERRVFRVAGTYAVVGWLIAQMAVVLEGALSLPGWFDTITVLVLLFGFPVAMILTWAFEVTPDGVRRGHARLPSSKGLGAADLAILAGLVLVAGLTIADWSRSGEATEAARDLDAQRAPTLAVAPIDARGGPAAEELAAALTDDARAGLSRFAFLDVTTDASDAAYLLEGTVRQAGETLRLTATLTDQTRGVQVWGRRFDRDADAENLLKLQDDLTDHLVASVADPHGALMRELTREADTAANETPTPTEAVLRLYLYRNRIGIEAHRETLAALEAAERAAPADASVKAALAAMHTDSFKHGYDADEASLDRALSYAQEAVSLDPTNALAVFNLAEVHYFRREVGAFRAAADRAIVLNPRDTDNLAMIGVLTAYSGDWERGVALADRAMALNPDHPGWYRFPSFFDAYRRGEYDRALSIAQAVNMPDYFADAYTRAIAHVRLGNIPSARAAGDAFEALWPSDLDAFRRTALEDWMYAQPDLQDAILADLQRAGVDVR